MGLVRRYGSTCPKCGARVLYDKVGGVYLREEASEETAGEDDGSDSAS